MTPRIRTWAITGAIAAVAAAIAAAVILPQLEGDPIAELGRGDYELATTSGESFTEDTLRGAPSAVFFGFTHCPEVCPTTLGEVDGWKSVLSEEGRDLRVFFVTVDPERDTLEVLGDYVSWVPGVTGVSGSPDEVAEAIRAFRIYAAKVPLEDGGYTMDHSASVLLFDAKGRLSGVIPYQAEDERALSAIRELYSS
ncbi:SCO family protein [Mangrovicoccus algicola]|uniref:SCO family protein n=1 Tax=Mangrovicoccus algicola TaxID=2771008 RepID=A0A8J7CJE4_9RHOB|nr:SCO family protein [Mangrovicoccus algicola]MBE3637591.1 SCO family protein [Mangrovicoccus algicola]